MTAQILRLSDYELKRDAERALKRQAGVVVDFDKLSADLVAAGESEYALPGNEPEFPITLSELEKFQRIWKQIQDTPEGEPKVPA